MPSEELQERALRALVTLAESQIDFYANLGLTDPRDLQVELDGWGFYPLMVPPYYRQSQGRGEVLPVYTTEAQLRLIRDRSRKLCVENEFAICAIENRKNYVVGKGFTYKAVARHDGADPKNVDRVQKILDGFVAANDLWEVELDVMHRQDVDGEAFIRIFPQENGVLLLRMVEPEHVKTHQDTYSPRDSFGIRTREDDVETIEGYWVVERPWENDHPRLIPAREIVHFKLNTPRNAKRGLPTFYAVEPNLRRAEDLLGSMTSMAKTRAKLALIRKFNGVTKATADALVSQLTDATVTDPATGVQTNLERLRFGSILNSSSNIDYEMPGSNVDAGGFVMCLQAELRAVASRLNMPEWMLTADASNANYSSSLVAEAPAVKNFERLQNTLKKKFGETRFSMRESLAWKQIRHAVHFGLLDESALDDVEVQVEAPTLTVRNKGEEAQLNQVYFTMGIKSPQTIASEQGLDYEQEQENLKEFREANPAPPMPETEALPPADDMTPSQEDEETLPGLDQLET